MNGWIDETKSEWMKGGGKKVVLEKAEKKLSNASVYS